MTLSELLICRIGIWVKFALFVYLLFGDAKTFLYFYFIK